MTPIKILLTNDDGFHAEGLQTLYEYLKDSPVTSSVTIVAPDRERSAVGHGITMNQPLRATLVEINQKNHWMVSGTPADCVKLAVEHLFKAAPPDLIISGINRGPNLGNDILYSGTVSAAIEGSFYKIPSLAASLAGYGKIDFMPASRFLLSKLEILHEFSRQAILNLNFPVLSGETTFKGVKFTKLGIRLYQNVFEERIDPRGQTYYWMGGEPVDFKQNPDSDIKTVEEGYVSITPLNTDLTDVNFLKNPKLNTRIF